MNLSSDIFELKYGGNTLARLYYDDELWRFWYTKEFIKDTEINPSLENLLLPEFPDKNKVYESQTLWLFFDLRIPSLKNPEIADIITKENINKQDKVALLKRFGRFVVSNPFVLDYLSF